MSNGDAVLNAHVKCKGEQRNMNAEICKERNFLQAIYKIKIFLFVCFFCAALEMKGTKRWVSIEVLLNAFLTKDYF